MKKTAFKTFVCSFVFSLFILFVINGLFFYTPQLPSKKIKIPSKNISLFFVNSTNSIQAAQVHPIKKIALTLPKIEKEASADVVYAPASQPLPSVAPQNASENSSPSREDLPIFDDIPLEIAKEDILPKDKDLVSADFDLIMNTPLSVFKEVEPQVEKALSSAIISGPPISHEKIVEDNLQQTENKASSHEPTSLIVAQTDFSAKGTPLLSVKSTEADQKTDLLKTPEEGEKPQQKEEQLLIPLQRDINAPQNKAFAVAKAAQPDQLAMVSQSAPLGSLSTAKVPGHSNEASASSEQTWKSMADKETPWVAAKGTKHPKNNKVLEAEYYQSADNAKIELKQEASSPEDNIKLAAEMVQNILIPIPDDILKEDPLIPQLDAPKDNSTKKDDAKSEPQKDTADDQSTGSDTDKKEDKDASTKSALNESKGSLLKSITSLFTGNRDTSSKEDEATTEDTPEEEKEYSNSFVDRITGRIRKSSNKPTKILPAEMRLAFQPNRAEISGTTLKWIHAFANKVNSDRSVILEIRIDGTSSYSLQQKRLNLLHNILTNKGVDYRKINTVFTTREPNSFIIRTVRINSNIDGDRNENGDQAAYYQAW